MRITAIQCEVCTHTYKLADQQTLPVGWIILSLPYEEDQHFCSLECFTKRMKERLQLVPDASTQPLEAPQSKIRRFLLFTENADEVEGIVWGNGCVSTNPEQDSQDMWFYRDWAEFQSKHPKCGVTWIDEVSSAN